MKVAPGEPEAKRRGNPGSANPVLGGAAKPIHFARNCTANKTQIKHAVSMDYANISCKISTFSPTACSLEQNKPQKRVIPHRQNTSFLTF
jgi:hypothetical protein